MTPEERIKALAEYVVLVAAREGVVLTIEQVAKQPLRMGNYTTVVSVRPARKTP